MIADGERPKDWFPLTGGDPCPGNPEGWTVVMAHWEQRALDMERLNREYVLPHISIDAEGNRFRRMEEVFSDLAMMLQWATNEFTNACETVKDWQIALRSMQERADEALRRARDAQEWLEVTQHKAAWYEQEAALDPLMSPRSTFLEMEIERLQSEIARQQYVVDEIRAEHDDRVAALRVRYQIRPLDVMYARSPWRYPYGNPWASKAVVAMQLDPSVDLKSKSADLVQLFERSRYSEEYLYQLLETLAGMTPKELEDFFRKYPQYAIFATNPVDRDTVQRAKDVARWWNAKLPPTYDEQAMVVGSADARKPGEGMLSEEQRLVLMKFAPGLIGNMQGVQYTYRSEANLNLLSVLSSDSDHSRGIHLNVTSRLGVTEEIRKTAATAMDKYNDLKVAGYAAQVVTFEVLTSASDKEHWDDVKAAVSTGNLDTAKNIDYLVPGMAANPQNSLGGHVDTAWDLHDQNKDNLDLYGGGSQATVAWLNYEAPKALPDLSVLGNQKAYAGGRRYAQDLDTLNTLRGEDNIRLNTVGHSYGTAVTFSGMTDMKTSVDSAVFIGSAGLPEEQVRGVNDGTRHLAVDPKNIAYTLAEEDNTAGKGYSLSAPKKSPAEINGATELNADGGYAKDGHYYQDTDVHELHDGAEDKQGYLDKGTSSLHQASLWLTGNQDRVGEFLDYVDPGDWQFQPQGGESYEYVPTEQRKDMSSPEDLQTLKDYARDQGIDWKDVQEGDPNYGQKKEEK